MFHYVSYICDAAVFDPVLRFRLSSILHLVASQHRLFFIRARSPTVADDYTALTSPSTCPSKVSPAPVSITT